jgi:hypothetical protein
MEPPLPATRTDKTPAVKRRRPLWLKIVLGAACVYLVIALLGWAWWSYRYPFGWSHSCSKILGSSLRLYAGDHDGWLPHGQATPEASLSLLVKEDPSSQALLRGKHLQQSVVDAALQRDGVLGPESCGWHYIEGLHEDDDPQIASVWDKVTGLWHNGDRRDYIMHEVLLLNGSMQFISRQKWPEFVAEQKKLLKETMASRSQGDPPLRWSDEATLGPNVNPPPTAPLTPPAK